jgi:hypothetical protein
MYAKLPWIIHRKSLHGSFRGPEVEAGYSFGLIKSLKHKMASTLYTLGCDKLRFIEEPHVFRY